MFKKAWLCASVLGALVWVGCEEKKDATGAVKDAAGKAAEATKSAVDSANEAGSQAADKVAEAGAAAKEKAGEIAAAAMDEVKQALGGDPQELLDKAMTYVKENKVVDAEAIFSKLEAIKSKLPAEWASKIDALRSAIETAKKAAGALPGVPK